MSTLGLTHNRSPNPLKRGLLRSPLLRGLGKGGLLLVGSYRDNEVSKAHPLYLTLQEIKKAKAVINTISLRDAYYSYIRWGAKAKVDDLAKRYPQLLAPIFQQEKLSIHSSQESTSFLSTLSDQQTVVGSKTSISDSLDLAAFIKASQALSGETELERLLSTLMKVVMENAGASKCTLILSEGDNLALTVTAVCSSSNFEHTHTEFPSTSLESSS